MNFSGSTLYGFSDGWKMFSRWASILECKVGTVEIHYPGVNINSLSRTIKFLDPLIFKIQRKLASWKGCSTTQAGHLVLLKATLDSLPIYWLSLYRLHKAIESKIDIIRKRFLWGHSKE